MSRRLEPWDVQRILHLRFSERLDVAEIAERFSCGLRVVSEIIQAYEQSEHGPWNIEPGERVQAAAREARRAFKGR